MMWIKSHASPRMNYYRPSQEQELPDDGLALLTRYVDVASYLVPSSTDEEATSKVLWHPDLHLDNALVDPDTHDIPSIVDWQSACVASLFYQSSIPRMFKHPRPVQEGWVIPERPENFNSLSQDEQKKIDDDLESENMHKYYAAQVCKRAPRHWTILQQPMVPMIRKPVWLVSGVWENKDLFFLRQSLISLATHWEKIFPGYQLLCPTEFTEKDIELHSEEENMDGIGQMLALFRDQGVLRVDGTVEPEDYGLPVKIAASSGRFLLDWLKMKLRGSCTQGSGHIKSFKNNRLDGLGCTLLDEPNIIILLLVVVLLDHEK